MFKLIAMPAPALMGILVFYTCPHCGVQESFTQKSPATCPKCKEKLVFYDLLMNNAATRARWHRGLLYAELQV